MRISPERYRTITIWALMALAVIIVSGAAVRLTNSGLGCDDWPQCNSEQLIDVSSRHAAIEQLNRLFTGVVGLAVVAAVLGSRQRQPRRDDLTRLSWWLVFGVAANAILGGISVKVDLHPLAVQGHLLLSMALIAVATVLVRRAGEPDGAPRLVRVDPVTEKLVWGHFALSCLAIVTGTLVTGAGPHAGDETAERLDIAIPTAARIHGVTVVLAIALAVVLARRTMRRTQVERALQRSLAWWIALGCAQAAIGYIQYFNGVPAVLVGVHVAGATAVMWASTVVLLDTRRTQQSDHEALSVEMVRT